ncbi:hypothetical protein J6590_079343 [Homalodisca vitripennis]|nr:hypothetical protein J6590_079343 [Homalodisca vitripennis]
MGLHSPTNHMELTGGGALTPNLTHSEYPVTTEAAQRSFYGDVQFLSVKRTKKGLIFSLYFCLDEIAKRPVIFLILPLSKRSLNDEFVTYIELRTSNNPSDYTQPTRKRANRR